MLTKMVLAKIGMKFRTEFALSGEQGLARLEDERPLPALVLLDLKMPGMDGLDVLRAMRGNALLSPIPVVVVTHSDLESDKEACYTAGANSFLHKSVDMDRFAIQIRKVLEKWMSS